MDSSTEKLGKYADYSGNQNFDLLIKLRISWPRLPIASAVLTVGLKHW